MTYFVTQRENLLNFAIFCPLLPQGHNTELMTRKSNDEIFLLTGYLTMRSSKYEFIFKGDLARMANYGLLIGCIKSRKEAIIYGKDASNSQCIGSGLC